MEDVKYNLVIGINLISKQTTGNTYERMAAGNLSRKDRESRKIVRFSRFYLEKSANKQQEKPEHNSGRLCEIRKI